MYEVKDAVVYTANLDYRGEAKTLFAVDVVGNIDDGVTQCCARKSVRKGGDIIVVKIA